MQYRLPPTLRTGAKIGVIAPASAAKRRSTTRGLAYLQEQKFRVQCAPNLNRGKFFLAGSDTLRLRYLQEYLLDPAIDAVICVRGGYGLIRLVDKLDYDRLAARPPKVFVGYSDITALQMALLAQCGWVTYSGPMVASDMGGDFGDYSAKWLWRMVMEHPYPIELTNPPEQPLQVWRGGEATGPLIGGCLSLITPLLGTPWAPSFKGAILVIEDIGEKTYHLDKHLQIMRLHGIFKQIAGMIVGQFTDCLPKNPHRSFTLHDYLTVALQDYDFPVLTNLAYGHLKQRLTLPIGVRVRLETAPPRITLLGV